MARNAVIDQWRQRRDTTQLPSNLTHPEISTEDYIHAKLAPCLRPMIESLPAMYADALRLTELDELPQAEAA